MPAARGRSTVRIVAGTSRNGSDDMKPARNIKTTPVEGNEHIKSLIALIDSLIAIVDEENTELAKGLPASRLKQVDEKSRLADLFEQCVADQTASLNVRDRKLREQLMERILRLRAAMDE